ncbi:MAG: hypothetical protein AAGA06_00175 [Pseudomonadota bacterium]
MRIPIAQNPARVHKRLSAGSLTPHEAAVRLVRVEFDVARLEREISVSQARIDRAKGQLARNAADKTILLGIIDKDAAVQTVKAKTDAA